MWGSPGAALLANLTDNELESVIEAIPDGQWKHETPDQLRKRVNDVRSDQISESLGEHYLGLDTISTPLDTSFARAALTLVGFKGEMTPKTLPHLRRRLLETARELDETLKDI